MRLGATSFDLSFDFLDHQLVLRTDRGESASFVLEDGLSVAEFDASLRRLLDELELSVAITRQPFGLKTNLPFPKDRGQSSYDADAVARTAPEPPALTTHELAPVEAQWQEGPTGSLALLPYDVVRASPDPRSTLLGFLQSAYEAGATAAEWDTAALASSFTPKRPG